MTDAVGRRERVRGRRRILRAGLGVLGLFALAYAIGPFLTMWRIVRALDSGDVAALQNLVDWSAVRQGLKDDITDGVIGMPQETLVASNTLPPFGASFISGIAGAEVDRTVTPQGLLLAAHQLEPAQAVQVEGPFSAIVQAGFSAPDQFDLHVRAPCQDPDAEPLHVRLEFHMGVWQVVRVWIPQDLMELASSRT